MHNWNQALQFNLMIFQKLGISSRALKALIGAMLIKFGTAIITCWGNINLYFLSYFHHQGTKITPQTNSYILLISIPPMILPLLFASSLCDKFGYQFTIRISCLLFCLSPLVNLIDFNIYVFTIFGIMIPGAMYSLISVPVLNCIWTQFPSAKNKSTSILVVAFGIGGLVWNFLFMHMINPNNDDAIDQHDNIHFFSQQVTKNVRSTAIKGFLITGILSFIGSLLIQRKPDQIQQLQQQKQQGNQYSKDVKTPTNKITQVKDEMTFRQALKDQRFILIMLISILTGFYEIYLMMNFKIIFMPIISDDHFLSYSSMICSVVAIVGAFIWGYLGDQKGVAFTILILSILDLFSKIFSDFAANKTMIIIMVVLIGLISKSMMTLAGPGFVEIFGLKLGTELLPMKGIAIILGYVLVPLFEVLTSKFLDPHQYLICISFLSIITLIAAIKLYYKMLVKGKNQKQQQLCKQGENDNDNRDKDVQHKENQQVNAIKAHNMVERQNLVENVISQNLKINFESVQQLKNNQLRQLSSK